MPNRILKESICTSETIDKLSYEEEVFFYRLLVQCDDYGRMDARLSILRARVFPLKLATIDDHKVATLLTVLSSANLLTVYLAGDKPYLQITTWDKHQQVRAKRSKYPAYDSKAHQLLTSANICNHLIAYVPVIQSNPIQSESNPNPNHGGVPKIPPPVKRVKKSYGEFHNVLLTDEEYQKLEEKFNSQLPVMIEKMSVGIASKGYKYKNHYAAILNWVRMDEEKGITYGEHKGFTEKSPERQHTNEELQQSYDNFKG